MITLEGKSYICSLCGWQHDEIDAAASMPRGLLQSFSPGLEFVLADQSAQRVADALIRHEAECPRRSEASRLSERSQ